MKQTLITLNKYHFYNLGIVMFDLIQNTDFEPIEVYKKVNKIKNKSETLRVKYMSSLRCFV